MKGIIKGAALVVGTALVTTVVTGRAETPTPTYIQVTPQTWTIQCSGGQLGGFYQTSDYSNDLRIDLAPNPFGGGFPAAELTGCIITTP